MSKLKVIKKEDQPPRRIRPEVTKRLLLDEKRELEMRLRKIKTELSKV